MANKKQLAADNGKPQSKSALIRRMISNSPELKNQAIAAILTSQGRKTSAQEVATQRSVLKRRPEPELSVSDLTTLRQIVKDNGGLKKLNNLLSEVTKLADQVGGEHKLREGLRVLGELAEIAP